MTKCHAVPAKDDKTILRVEALAPPASPVGADALGGPQKSLPCLKGGGPRLRGGGIPSASDSKNYPPVSSRCARLDSPL